MTKNDFSKKVKNNNNNNTQRYLHSDDSRRTLVYDSVSEWDPATEAQLFWRIEKNCLIYQEFMNASVYYEVFSSASQNTNLLRTNEWMVGI